MIWPATQKVNDSIYLELCNLFVQWAWLSGTRSWKVNFDATSLDSNLLRRCLVVSWKSLALTQVSLADLLPTSLGAVVIIIPARLSELNDDEQQVIEKSEHLNRIDEPLSAVHL